MNRHEIIKDVSESTGLTESKVALIFNELLSELKLQLFNNKIVNIKDFGTFELKIGEKIKDNFNNKFQNNNQNYEIKFSADNKLVNF